MKLLLLFVLFAAAFMANCDALKNEVCALPHSKNGNGLVSCFGYMPSWTYNGEINQCIKFIYGGCGGNANRFGNQELCEAKCKE